MKDFWQWLTLVIIVMTLWGLNAYSLLTSVQ
jgi:hypothetical protein